MERGEEFNDLMKDSFKDAEATPSENVWTNIELELEKEEGGIIRRRLFYYKMVAAASVIFALSVGAATFFILNTSSRNENHQTWLEVSKNSISTENQNLKLNEESNSEDIESKVTQEGRSEEKTRAKNIEVTNANDDLKSKNQATGNSTASSKSSLARSETSSANNFNEVFANTVVSKVDHLKNHQDQRLIDETKLITQSSSIQAISISGLPRKMNSMNIKKLEETEVKPDAGALLLAKLAQEEQAMQEEDNTKQDRSDRLWTSVGFAAGSFNAVNTSVSPTTLANQSLYQNVSMANQQAKASGSTYSVGINLGTKLTNRWILQGGLNYMTQGSDYTANSVVASADYKNFEIASLNQLTSDARTTNVVSTAAYQVTNTLQYVNVPIQAGYLIINRKVRLQVNTGISTDLFLQNTLTPQNSNLEKTTHESGSDSPYRSVNFSGLFGAELSYKMGDRYRVALNPGFHYPFSSIYKDDLGVSVSPLTFDVGLRLQYVFH